MRRLASVRRGRPRKFNRPARTVSVTLPEDVIAALRTVDPDLSRAIVHSVLPVTSALNTSRSAELSTFGNRSLIVVPRSRELAQRIGMELVPLPDGRALITLDDDMSLADLELRLHDSLEDALLADGDRVLVNELLEILRTARRDDAVVLRQRRILLLHWPPSGPPPLVGPRAGTETA
jgi:hypothetical protein